MLIERKPIRQALLGLLAAVAIGTGTTSLVLIALAGAVLIWIHWPRTGLAAAVLIDGAFRFLL